MSTTEHDVELLELYLDSELAPEQAEQLRLRAASDPSLNAIMHRLSQQRAVRRGYFQTLEPSDQQIDAMVARIDALLRRQRWWGQRVMALRRLTAAAACVLAGIGLGWVGRSALMEQDHRLPERVGQGVIHNTNTVMQPMVGGYDSNLRRSHPWADADGYKVAITDAFGRVIAIQRFQTLHEAMEFSRSRDQLPIRISPFDRLPPGLQDRF